MQTIQANPNSSLAPALQELPPEATTIIDAMDQSPQLKAATGVLYKGPNKLVHSEANRQAISQAKQQRGKAGILGKQWS
jgi:hypothetical protein